MPKIIKIKRLFAPKTSKVQDQNVLSILMLLQAMSETALRMSKYFRKMKDLLKKYDQCYSKDPSSKNTKKAFNDLMQLPVKNAGVMHEVGDFAADPEDLTQIQDLVDALNDQTEQNTDEGEE